MFLRSTATHSLSFLSPKLLLINLLLLLGLQGRGLEPLRANQRLIVLCLLHYFAFKPPSYLIHFLNWWFCGDCSLRDGGKLFGVKQPLFWESVWTAVLGISGRRGGEKRYFIPRGWTCHRYGLVIPTQTVQWHSQHPILYFTSSLKKKSFH